MQGEKIVSLSPYDEDMALSERRRWDWFDKKKKELERKARQLKEAAERAARALMEEKKKLEEAAERAKKKAEELAKKLKDMAEKGTQEVKKVVCRSMCHLNKSRRTRCSYRVSGGRCYCSSWHHCFFAAFHGFPFYG